MHLMKQVKTLFLITILFSIIANTYGAPILATNTTNNVSNTIVYDGNIVAGYNAYIAELKRNCTELNKTIQKKDKLLGEYIGYKKENIILNDNITDLENTIYTLRAELETANGKNKEYRTMFEEIITQQGENSKDMLRQEHNDYLGWINRVFWSFFVVVLSIFAILMYSNRADKRHKA
ncbi:hypothetical protein J3E07_001610 [Methanococcus voltae]|uniref:Uncharacterized protein n=1 Tax=Methanococcus voltae TaxID=2188 RepID=A0A8J7RGV7_METVO|nr:hypothetical protein [Methanococcus voltae]MBP2202169.1 hypothetical protein [Methanococcus voltae]